MVGGGHSMDKSALARSFLVATERTATIRVNRGLSVGVLEVTAANRTHTPRADGYDLCIGPDPNLVVSDVDEGNDQRRPICAVNLSFSHVVCDGTRSRERCTGLGASSLLRMELQKCINLIQSALDGPKSRLVN